MTRQSLFPSVLLGPTPKNVQPVVHPSPVLASELLSFFLSVRERHANLGATNGVPDKTGFGNG